MRLFGSPVDTGVSQELLESHRAGRFWGVWENYLQGATRGAVDKDVAIRRDLGGRPVQASAAGPQGPHPQGPWGTCTRDGDH